MTAPIAFVHHANQFVITDGYPNREGISVISAGFDAVMTLHVELGVPMSLHISGPVLESLAWHRPALLDRLREHLTSGFVSLIGGTYGENIMPLATASHNRRQLRAFHDLAEDLLGIPRAALQTAWVPERVWDTASCATPLLDESATGVAYRRVLLDDRLTFPLRRGSYEGSPRQEFDETGPYRWHETGFPSSVRGLLQPDLLAPYKIAGADGLVAVPIASHLRYLVPPHHPDHLRLLAELGDVTASALPGSLLVFADDLERVAGVGGWDSRGLERYALFLRWLRNSDVLHPVDLDDWCNQVEPERELELEAGTYFELAHHHGAGENYHRWSKDRRWQPYAKRLERVEIAVEQAEQDGADPYLCELAERLLLLGRHETAWQDPDAEGGRAPAPWACATAAHASDALPVLAAARWAAFPGKHGLRVLVTDIDEDGEDEVVMSNDRLFAVLSPRHGGRLTLLVTRGDDADESDGRRGVVLVGNPADHWNFQAELGKHMDEPPNHPGALAVLGTENHRHGLGRVEVTEHFALVELIDVEPGTDRGLSKRILLSDTASSLVAGVWRGGLPGELRTAVALSPDYLGLLKGGRRSVSVANGNAWWSVSSAGTNAWVAYDPGEGTDGLVGTSPVTGHALVGAVDSCGRHAHLVIGTGHVDDTTGPELIKAALPHLHPEVTTAPLEAAWGEKYLSVREPTGELTHV